MLEQELHKDLWQEIDSMNDTITDLNWKLDELRDEVEKLKKWAKHEKMVTAVCNEMWNDYRNDNYYEFHNNDDEEE